MTPGSLLAASLGGCGTPQVLKERGIGCGIVVAAGAKATAASFSLRDPNEVQFYTAVRQYSTVNYCTARSQVMLHLPPSSQRARLYCAATVSSRVASFFLP